MESLFSNNPVASVSSDRILYTPSSFARSSLLHLQEIGTLKALREHTSSRSNLLSYLFFIVTKGSGSLLYNGKEYRLSEGSCVFVNCQKLYSHTTDPDDLWSLRWCHFYGPNLSLIYEKYTERGGKPMDRQDRQTTTGLPGMIISETCGLTSSLTLFVRFLWLKVGIRKTRLSFRIRKHR